MYTHKKCTIFSNHIRVNMNVFFMEMSLNYILYNIQRDSVTKTIQIYIILYKIIL